ncbi:MAG: hypothetical protein IPK85_04200 [Gemmatimonadetes bacterium]|nr:hypothetical protein [Gemmatimonadota bacterium]
MATRYWSPSADGNFQTAANWLDSSGAPSGGAPANSDTLIFNQGSASVNAGLTNSLTGLTIVGLPQFTGDIGTLGAALVTTSIADIQWASSGRWAKFSATVTKFDATVQHGQEFHMAGGVWGNNTSTTPLKSGGPGWIIMDGSATFASGTTIFNAGSRWVVANGTASNVPVIENEQGTFTSKRTIGAVYNSPGAIFRLEEAASSGVIRNWGRYVHWTSDTAVVVHAKARSEISVRGTKAVTPTIATVFEYAGSTIQDNEGGARLTITTRIAVGDITAPTQAMVAG